MRIGPSYWDALMFGQLHLEKATRGFSECGKEQEQGA